MEKMSKIKAIVSSVVAIAILVVSQMLAGYMGSLLLLIGVPTWICDTFAGVIYLVLALLLVQLIYKKLMHIETTELGITKFSLKWKWVLIGLLLPCVIMAVYLLFIPGDFVSSEMNTAKKLEVICSGIFFSGIGAGFVEEIVFRGALFHSLEKAWNTKVAVIVPSVLFGALHILGMDYSFGSCLLVILAGTAVGIMFSLITIESGSVWCNGFTHAVWNMIIIGGVLTIADKADKYSITTYVLRSKVFAITGGEFGIEASAIALAGYIIVCVIAILMIRKGNSNENQKLYRS